MDTPVVRRSTRRRTPTQTNSTPTPNPTRSRRKSKKTKTEEEEEKKKSSNDAKAEEDNNQVDVPVEKDDKQVNNTKRGRKRKTSDDKPSSPILKADSNGEKDKEVVPNKRKRRSTSVSASASKKTSKRTSRRTPSKEVAREGPVNTEELAEGTTQSKTASPSSLSENKVCQKAPHSQKNKRRIAGTYPYYKLEPNSKFITPYGIVQVITDCNTPPDHNDTCIPEDARDKITKYSRKTARIQKRKKNVILFNAKKQLKRRRNILEIYMKDLEEKKRKKEGGGGDNSKNKNGDKSKAREKRKKCENKKKDEEEYNKTFAGQIWKEYCTLTIPSRIFSGKYHQNADNEIMKQTQVVEKHPWNTAGDDPSVPADSYPNRIVECVLINDERRRVSSLTKEKEGEGRISQMSVAKESVEKAKREQRRKKRNSSGQEKDATTMSAVQNLHKSNMKLYLRRNMLVNHYTTKIPNYDCAKCGLSFISRMGLKAHLPCVSKTEKVKQDRELRLQHIEEAVISDNIKGPQQLTQKKAEKSGDKSVTPPSTKRKKHKKWPAWLEFYPALSPIYPEIFASLKFRRGSNNNKFMLKKLDAIGPGRKKFRKSRARKVAVYPEVMKFLFPELQSPSPFKIHTPKSRSKPAKAASNEGNETLSSFNCQDPSLVAGGDSGDFNPGGDNNNPDDFGLNHFYPSLPMLPAPTIGHMPSLPNIPLPVPNDTTTVLSTTSTSMKICAKALPPCAKDKQRTPTQEDNVETTSKKKKKRKKSPLANPKSTTCVVVDIRPLVEEIRAGRYPSMKEYTDDHLNICFACKNKGSDLYFCEFCENAEHLSCVQSRVTIRDPEPDDEFMCHRCIQTVMARRSRAEKRRLQKLDEAMNKTSLKAGANAEMGTGVISTHEAKAVTALKREIVWNQAEFDAHVVSYKKCPSGGPGGLICCAICTANYSRLLSETSKEMDAQTVSSIGREVSELMQLLHDAKERLQQSTDVSNANSIRMSLLNNDQVGFDRNVHIMDDSEQNGHATVMGFMDILSGK